MKTEFGASRAMVLKYLKPLLFVLILPVIKGVINYFLDGGFSGVIIAETFLALSAVCFAYTKYRSFKVTVNESHIIISDGVFIKTHSEIKISDISCITLSISLLDIIFGSSYLRINTEAGSRNKCDFEFRLKKDDAQWLYNRVYRKEPSVKVKYPFLRVVLSVAAYTSVLTGVVVGVPIINNAGKLLNYGITDYLLNELNTVSNKFSTYFPPIANAITLIFVFFYLISFVYSLFKYGRFRFNVSRTYAQISRGLITRVHTRFNKNSVNCVLAEQNIMLRLLKLYSVRLSIGGFGVGKGETSVMDPCCSRTNAHIFLTGFFPFFNTDECKHSRRIRPHKKTLFRYFNAPFWWYVCLLPVFGIAYYYFSYMLAFIVFAAGIYTAFFVYYLTLRYYAYKNGYIVIDNVFSLRTIHGFKTADYYFPKEKVGYIKIIRWPLDMKFNTCSVRVSVLSEHADSATALFVDYKQVKEKMQKLYKIDIQEC